MTGKYQEPASKMLRNSEHWRENTILLFTNSLYMCHIATPLLCIHCNTKIIIAALSEKKNRRNKTPTETEHRLHDS